MGITTPLDGIPAEGIGGLRLGVTPLELTDAYATLAAGGIHRKPVSIEKVTFPNGRVERPQAAQPRRVLPEAVAYEVTRLLHDNITEGTGTAAYTGCAGQAGKTGTTDEYTDAWFSGYQPNLATAVWVGYPESNDVSMTSVHGITVFGGTFPAEIWHSLYSGAGVPCEEFEKPEKSITWAPYYGHFTEASPRDSSGTGGGGEPPPPGSAAVGGYDPNDYDPDAYAPGAGQEPAPLPPPPPSVSSGGGAAAGSG
jgi:penicillin-binding protein 1A